MSLANNLLAYWRLNESSGNATDATGGGRTLTNHNTVTYTTGLQANAADFGASNTNKALARTGYTGTDGAMSVSLFVKLQAEIGSGNWWFYVNATESTAMELVYEYNGGTRRLVARRARNSLASAEVVRNITLGTSNWYHIVMTYSGSELTLYINAVAETPVSASGNGTINWSPGGGGTSLGCAIDANNPGTRSAFASVLMDEFAIWQRALTAGEVTQLYNGGVGVSYPFPPEVTTQAVTDIQNTTADGNGTVVNDNGSTITERGIVWSTSPSPVTSSNKIAVSGTTGAFVGDMTGLNSNTFYYVRAYAINAGGTSYGGEVTFTTLNVDQYDISKDYGFTAGDNIIGRINVTGTTGSVTVKLGSTGAQTVISAGAGNATFQGVYGGINGLIVTRSADFNGTIDNIFHVVAPPGTSVNWDQNVVTIVAAIDSEVTFKRIEDDAFNSFLFYRYLDLLFKDLDGYVTVTIRSEREDNTTSKVKTFSVGNTGLGEVSPFQKKRISFLSKNQAIIITLSNASIGETFSIAKFLLTGYKLPQRMFSPGKINSV